MPLPKLYELYIRAVGTRGPHGSDGLLLRAAQGREVEAPPGAEDFRDHPGPQPPAQAPLRPLRASLRSLAPHRRRAPGDRASFRGFRGRQPARVRLLPRAHGRGQGTTATRGARAVGSRLEAAVRDTARASAGRVRHGGRRRAHGRLHHHSSADGCGLFGATIRAMDSLEARSLIPLTAGYIHMNHAGVSPMSLQVAAAVEQVVGASVNLPYPGGWAREEADRVRGLVAHLINVPSDSIALTRSTAHGISLLAQGLDWKPGDNVVGAHGEYPANVYPWMAQAARGVDLRQVHPQEGRISPEQVFSVVDARTRVVALSHVEFWNGFRLDIETIGAECRRRGILFAVDVMQSAGALRLDVGRLPIDFCAAGAGKWLMGPPGIGFCFCMPELIERLQPPIVGVCSVVGYDRYFEYDLTLSPTARRFEESVVSLLDTAAFGAALGLLLEVGSDAIEARVLSLSARLAEGLDRRGYELVEPWPRAPAESSGIVSFRKRRARPQEVLRALEVAHVVARIHQDFVRLSPHFYNTEEEIDRVLEVLAPQSVTT